MCGARVCSATRMRCAFEVNVLRAQLLRSLRDSTPVSENKPYGSPNGLLCMPQATGKQHASNRKVGSERAIPESTPDLTGYEPSGPINRKRVEAHF